MIGPSPRQGGANQRGPAPMETEKQMSFMDKMKQKAEEFDL